MLDLAEAINKLDIFVFNLNTKKRYGINVFSIKELKSSDCLKSLRQRHPMVCAQIDLAGTQVPIIDLSMAIGQAPQSLTKNTVIILTTINKGIQGWLVSTAYKMMSVAWKAAVLPENNKCHEGDDFLIATVPIAGEEIGILDMEKILCRYKSQLSGIQ